MRLTKSEIDYKFYTLDNGPVRVEIFWVIVAWVVVSYIQYLLASALHIVLAIALSVGISVLASILYQGLKQMGGNGVNRSGSRYSFSVLVISIIVLSVNVGGVYQLVLLWGGGPWNVYLLAGWILLFAGGPVVYSLWQYIVCYRSVKRHSQQYVALRLRISHYHELPIHIHKIQFVNTETGASEVFTDLAHSYSAYSWRQQPGDDLIERVRNAVTELYFDTLYIPVNANKFYVSWYSFAENKYYEDEFPFKYERFEPTQSRFPYGRTDTNIQGIKTYELNSIELYIKSKGRADLYVGGWLLFFFWDVAEVQISESERERFQREICHGCQYPGTLEEFRIVMENIRASGRLDKRYDRQGKMFLWSLSVEGLGELKHHVNIDDTEHKHHARSIGKLATPDRMCLPEKLTFFKWEDESLYFYYYVYINRDALHDCIVTLTQGRDDIPVHLHLHVNNRLRRQMTFEIRANNETVTFDAWQADTTGA